MRLFETYIDFMNLDEELYLSSMTHVVPPAEDASDEGEGLGVATVDLGDLREVLAKHRVG